MTLPGYQRALSEMIASPALCLAVRARGDEPLDGYPLTERERMRLRAVARQPGMSTSCTLYRLNRMTPLARYLPLTTQLLGDGLVSEAELFWDEGIPSDLQFGPESDRFARFLLRRLEAGELEDAYLAEILALELAVNRVRVAPTDGQLTETVVFSHDPLPLLAALAEGERPDPPPSEGRFELVVDASAGSIELRPGARPARSEPATR